MREPIDPNALRTCPHSIAVYVEEPPLDWRHEVNSVVTVVSHAWINLTPTPTKREVLIGSNFRSSRPNIFVSSDSLTNVFIKCSHQVRLHMKPFVSLWVVYVTEKTSTDEPFRLSLRQRKQH